jgi:hypothetical protein
MFELVVSMLASNRIRVGLACLTLTLAALAVYIQLGMSFATFYGISRVAADVRAPFIVASHEAGLQPGGRSISPEQLAILTDQSHGMQIEGLLLGVTGLMSDRGGKSFEFTARPVSVGPGSLSAPRSIGLETLQLLARPMTVILPEQLAQRGGLAAGDTVQSPAGPIEVVGVADFGSDLAQAIVSVETFLATTYWTPARREARSDSYRFVLLAPMKGVPEPGLDDVRAAIGAMDGLDVFTPDSFDRSVISYGLSRSDQLRAIIVTGGVIMLIITVIISQTFSSLVINYASSFSSLQALGVSSRQLIRAVVWLSLVVWLLSMGLGTALAFLQQNLFFRLELPTVFLPHFTLIAGSLLFFGSLIAVAISSSSILRMRPVDLLR